MQGIDVDPVSILTVMCPITRGGRVLSVHN